MSTGSTMFWGLMEMMAVEMAAAEETDGRRLGSLC